MKSALILALAGSSVAAPAFGDFWDAIFGGDKGDGPTPPGLPDFPPPPPGGSGMPPFPFPTAPGEGAFPPIPTGTSGAAPFPFPFPGGPGGQQKRKLTPLNIDYQLAPTAAPVVKRREVKYRQLGGSALPGFSLLDPNAPAAPTATEPVNGAPTALPGVPSGLPTPPAGGPTPPTGRPTRPAGGPPAGFPTPPAGGPPGSFPTRPAGGPPAGFPTPPAGGPPGGFPGNGPTAPFPIPTGDAPSPPSDDALFPTAPAGTGAPGFPGFPGLPTTLGTVTRGPRPTAAPEAPGQEDGQQTGPGNNWWQMIKDFFNGGKGRQN